MSEQKKPDMGFELQQLALAGARELPPFSEKALDGVMHIALTGHMARTLLRIGFVVVQTLEGQDRFAIQLAAAADTDKEELMDIMQRIGFNLRALMIGAEEDYGAKEEGREELDAKFADKNRDIGLEEMNDE